MFLAEDARPSLVARQITTGPPLRRWALAAMVTVVSVMPLASLARVLPVQGQITSTSSRCLGPMGSALGMESMTRLSQIRSISRMYSWAGPNRLSVAALASETMGVTSP